MGKTKSNEYFIKAEKALENSGTKRIYENLAIAYAKKIKL